jgi:hypothetical protein
MVISHDLKIIFIHVHRTAGTALTNILLQNLDTDFEILTQHSNARSLGPAFLEKHSDYYSFGFTRNPWERVLSWYALIHLNDQKSLAEERKRFQEFIEMDSALDHKMQFFHYNSLDYFSNEKGELLTDQIFKYENLENEIGVLGKKLRFPLSEIPVINETGMKNYKEYYSDKSRSLIAQKCKKDIEYFNYEF